MGDWCESLEDWRKRSGREEEVEEDGGIALRLKVSGAAGGEGSDCVGDRPAFADARPRASSS